MTDKDISLQLKRFFDSTVETVFSAWTESDQLKQWHAPSSQTVGAVQVDLRIGGQYRIEMINKSNGKTSTVWGEYKNIDPNKRLVYTWEWEGDVRHKMQVTIDFLSKDGGTEVILTHERFANTESRDQHQFGWDGCFDSLQLFLADATENIN